MFDIYRMMFFYFDKGMNYQMHFSSDAHHLIKKSIPSKISHSSSTRGDFLPPPLNALENSAQWHVEGFCWHTINYTTSGYMLNADGHLID